MQTARAVDRRFGYDGAALIAEYTWSGQLTRRYVHGPGVDEPLVWYEGAGTLGRHFLHAFDPPRGRRVGVAAAAARAGNMRGSIIAISNGSGAVTAINSYDEYGIPGAANTGRFRYTGQAWIPELGMHYYKARTYSPTLGRFLQTDPIGYGDGMNLYAHVRNDPVNRVDPWGLSGVEALTDLRNLPIRGITVLGDACRVRPCLLPSAIRIEHTPAGQTEQPGGTGPGGEDEIVVTGKREAPRSESLRCFGSAIWDNRVDWALNGAGAGFVLISGKYQLAAAIGGGAVSMAGLGWATANRDAQGAGAAFTGKQASNMGLAEAGSGLAKFGQRLGAAAVAFSIVRTSSETRNDYQQCMNGAS